MYDVGMAATTKQVRALVIGDEFYPPHHPQEKPVRLVSTTVKTGAWYELSVHWVGESDVWVINPKPMGTQRVRLSTPNVSAVVSS